MKPALKPILLVMTLFMCLMPSNDAHAQRTKVLVILDIDPVDIQASESDLLLLTESIYSAATSFPPNHFAVISREKLSGTLADSDKARSKEFTKDDIGTMLGADLVLSCTLTGAGNTGLSTTVKLSEVNTGMLLGLEHAQASNVQRLSRELRIVTDTLLAHYAGTGDEKAGENPLVQPPADNNVDTTPKVEDFLVHFRVEPRNATIRMDDLIICRETPCSCRIEKGIHKFVIETELHQKEEKEISIDNDKKLNFKLQPKKYSYFGMNDTEGGGWLVTGGLSPLDTEYKTISVIDGFHFALIHPIVDIGFGGGVFGYRSGKHGDSWSILGFGPAVRAGRLTISSQIQLLSFRHESRDHGEGWLPGISLMARIPLLNSREAKAWANLIPTPTVGMDVWFHDLSHDQTLFWVGLSWPGGVHF